MSGLPANESQDSAPEIAQSMPSQQMNGPTSDSATKLQHANALWRNLDFTTLTATLDSTASEIVTYQRDSTLQRKELAQKTKDFRKLDDGAKLAEVKGLLKAYQAFIDLITNHSRSVNSAFLQTYTAFSDVPDPSPLLEASLDALLVSTETVPRLRDENTRLHSNVSDLHVQLENAEAQLQTERTTRKDLEDNLERQLQEVATSWTAVLDEKKDNWTAKERAFEEKIENQERLLTETKANYEVIQRLSKGGDEQGQQRGQVSSSELEMLHADLERTSTRLADMEARNENLRIELAQAKATRPVQQKQNVEDDPDYMRIRSENASLIRRVDATRAEKDSLKRSLESKLQTLSREVQAVREEKELLRVKVQKWSDYDNVKQELDVLKSLEFSGGDEELDPSLVAEPGSEGETLEKLLLARNKKLGDELTLLRVSQQELQARLGQLQEELTRTNTELEGVRKLNEKLEADLEDVQAEGANAFPSGASFAGTYMTLAASRNKGRTSPTSSIISGLDPRSAAGERDAYVAGPGILPMVTAQRDRFKKKNTELEHEISECHRTVQQLRQEVAALQKDNLNLYEKTRYVSTYNRSNATASASSAYSGNPYASSTSVGAGPASPGMNRYQKEYESNISPFAAFRGRESARAYRGMSLPERVVYTITRLVLQSRSSRNLFAAYCVALHMLVFLTLYWLGSADTEKHASLVGGAAAAAAGGLSGGIAAGAGGQGGSPLKGDPGQWTKAGFDAAKGAGNG